jgi:hypothetical protein
MNIVPTRKKISSNHQGSVSYGSHSYRTDLSPLNIPHNNSNNSPRNNRMIHHWAQPSGNSFNISNVSPKMQAMKTDLNHRYSKQKIITGKATVRERPGLLGINNGIGSPIH